MWIFICLLCVLGTILTLIKISLLERKLLSLVLACLTAILCLISIPWATHINMQGLTRFLNDLNVLNDLCVLLVIESVAMLLVVAYLMKQHIDRKPVSLAKVIILLPSSACLTGIFLLMVLLFNTITGRSYLFIGCIDSLVVFGALGCGALVIRRFMAGWYTRLEMMLILSFIQLILAMFLPLVARGLTVPIHASENHALMLLASVGLSILFAGTAFLIRAMYNRLLGDKSK
jgi:hypothetical protein